MAVAAVVEVAAVAGLLAVYKSVCLAGVLEFYTQLELRTQCSVEVDVLLWLRHNDSPKLAFGFE